MRVVQKIVPSLLLKIIYEGDCKMRKKILGVILCLCLCGIVMGCGNGDPGESSVADESVGKTEEMNPELVSEPISEQHRNRPQNLLQGYLSKRELR